MGDSVLNNVHSIFENGKRRGEDKAGEHEGFKDPVMPSMSLGNVLASRGDINAPPEDAMGYRSCLVKGRPQVHAGAFCKVAGISSR